MSRRSAIVLGLALVMVVGYFVVPIWIRAHVDELIQHSVGKPLPEFAIVDRAGKPWRAADLRGKRAVLHFFRSRCHSCDLEAQAYRDLERELPSDVVLLHVMTDAVLKFPPADTEATIAAKRFAQPIVLADAAFADSFHKVSWSNVTPITYIVDAKGVVRYGLRGAQTRERIAEALAAVQ